MENAEFIAQGESHPTEQFCEPTKHMYQELSYMTPDEPPRLFCCKCGKVVVVGKAV